MDCSEVFLDFSLEPMNCIIKPVSGVGGLYLGNIESASNGKLLGYHDIGAILSVMSTKDYSYDSHIAHKVVSPAPTLVHSRRRCRLR